MSLTLVDQGRTPVPTGPGIELYSVAVAGGTLYVTVAMAPGGVVSTSTAFAPVGVQPNTVLNHLNATTGSLPAGAITGGPVVTLKSTGATPGAQLVRTAAQMLADVPGGQVGMTWNLRITNTGAGTLTLTADGGATVTLVGTMTVPQNTTRDFVCTINTATTATIEAVGVGTYS